MKQPELLLIDDEPALAEFVANAARECGFEPVVTSNDAMFRDLERRQAVAGLGLAGQLDHERVAAQLSALDRRPRHGEPVRLTQQIALTPCR